MKTKNIIAILIIILIVTTPLSYALDENYLDIEFNKAEDSENMEDILINVVDYQPKVVPAWGVEKENYPVLVLLSGVQTNPTIEIPKIDSVSVRVTGDRKYIAGQPVHVPPRKRDYTLDDLGYILIKLKKIPKESDVPDVIDLNLTARVNFRVTRGFGVYEQDMILKETSESEWLPSKEKDSFWLGKGYVRAEKLEDTKGKFVIYDDVFRDVYVDDTRKENYRTMGRTRSVTLSEGQTSGTIYLKKDYLGGVSEDITLNRLMYRNKFKIKLNDIRYPQDQAKLQLIVNGEIQERTVVKNEPILDGSAWKLVNIERLKGVDRIELSDGTNHIFVIRSLKECGTYKEEGLCKEFSYCEWKDGVCKNKVLISEENKEKNKEPTQAQTLNLEAAKNAYDQAKVKYDEGMKNKDDTLIQESVQLFLDVIKNYADTPYFNLAEIEVRKIASYYGNNPDPAKKDIIKFNNILYDLEQTKKQANKEVTNVQVVENSNSKDYYLKAIESYEKVIDQYPEVNDINGEKLAAKAQLEIAKIYDYGLDDKDKAIQAYSKFLNDYPESDNLLSVDNRIKILKDTNNYQYVDGNIYEEENNIQIRLLSIEKPDQGKAYISIDGGAVKEFKVGESIFDDETNDKARWYVERIIDDEVTIKRSYVNEQGEKIVEETKKLELNKDIGVMTQSGSKSLRLTSLDAGKREAYITILPGDERIYGESNFMVHIPIEKRLWSLTPEQIDSHIETTKNMIKKFDTTINFLEKNVFKFWNTWCYSYFAYAWLKTLITGFGGRNLARKIVMEKWDAECSKETNFDECIKEHAKDIMDEINITHYAVKTSDDFIKSQQYESLSKDPNSIYYNLDKETVRSHKLLEELSKQNWADENTKEGFITDFINADLSIKTALKADSTIDALTEDQKNKLIYDLGRQVEYDEANAEIKKQIEQEVLSIERQREYDYQTTKLLKDSSGDLNQELVTEYANNLNINKEFVTGALKTKYSQLFPEASALNNEYVLNINKNWISQDKSGLLKYYPEAGKGGSQQLYTQIIGPCSDPNGCYNDAVGDFKEDEQYYYIDNGKFVPIKSVKVEEAAEIKEDLMINLYDSGRQKGRLYRISLNQYEYAELTRDDVGRIKEITVWRRAEPNSNMGESTDKLVKKYSDEDRSADSRDKFYKDYQNIDTRINNIENELKKKDYESGQKIKVSTGLLAKSVEYKIKGTVAKKAGLRCYDFMDVNDCLWLFGACDPVMCPASRFNAGGNWPVSNVIQTGIFGSIFLGLNNYDPAHGEILPVCLPGVISGLKNYRSILQGYVRCLEKQKADDQSVGICDRIRNVGVCKVLWREAAAMLNLESGLFGVLSKKVFDKGSGGGEYAFFKENMKNTVDFMNFFTQDYATSVFAAYRGNSVGEIGGKLCEAAIYSRVPGGGSLIEQLTKPAGPPQVIAFIDEVPHSNIEQGVLTRGYLSDYQVYYHIYAGSDKDIQYSVFLRGQDLPVLYISGYRRLLTKGDFVDENKFITQVSGYNEICVELDGDMKCGFGKVSTDYGINKLEDMYVANEVNKQTIKTEKQCVPEYGLLQSASGPGTAALSLLGSGLVQTGVQRKCSVDNPGKGTNTETQWAKVGICGNDNLGRSLGDCWLNTESIALIKDAAEKKATAEKFKELIETQKIAAPLTKQQITDKRTEIDKIINEAETLGSEAKRILDRAVKEKTTPSEDLMKVINSKYKEAESKYLEAIPKDQEIIDGTLISDINEAGKTQFKIAETYKKIADMYAGKEQILLSVKTVAEAIEKAKKEVKGCEQISSKEWKCYNFAVGQSYSLDKYFIKIELGDYNWDVPINFNVYLGNELVDCNGYLGTSYGGGKSLIVKKLGKEEDCNSLKNLKISADSVDGRGVDFTISYDTGQEFPYTVFENKKEGEYVELKDYGIKIKIKEINKERQLSPSVIGKLNYVVYSIHKDKKQVDCASWNPGTDNLKVEGLLLNTEECAGLKVLKIRNIDFDGMTISFSVQYIPSFEKSEVNACVESCGELIPCRVNCFKDIIKSASRTYSVDENLIKAVIYHESAGMPNAVSCTSAAGLMQLMPDTARIDLGLNVPNYEKEILPKCGSYTNIKTEKCNKIHDENCDFKNDERFNPEKNIPAGTRYFKQQLKNFNENEKLALAAYYAGPGNVGDICGERSFEECRNDLTLLEPKGSVPAYVDNILERKTQFEALA